MKKLNWYLGLCLVVIFCTASVSVLADDDAIMDVDDNAAAFVGTWTSSTTRILYYGDDYQWANGSGSGAVTKEATWTTANTADITGNYEVYVRWTTHPNREESAVYRVYNGVADTSANCSCSMNQTINGGAWRYCCTTTLSAGQKGVVKLGNENTDTNEVVIADGVRFVRAGIGNNAVIGALVRDGSLSRADIGDEPGIEWVGSSSKDIATISTDCTTTPNWTNLTSFTLTAPASGYVVVNANGIAALGTADRWVRVCISDVSTGSGCDSLAPYIEHNADEVATNYEDESRYALSEVYSVSSGSKTYYLKACRESGATGNLMWNDFYGLYVPTRY